jgi:ABC-type polar amino acid transport system ATPase subunit
VTVLTLAGVELRRDDRTLVEDLSFSLARGERVALMGASGTGKTTILRAVAGLETFSKGSIEIGVGGHLKRTVWRRVADSRLSSKNDLRPHYSSVGMVFQFHHLFAHISAIENVWLAPVHVLRQPRHEAEAHARHLLEKLGVAHRAAAMPHELSGGEAQRVAIARALAMKPRVLLMDEPTASLDPGRRGELAATVRGLSDDGTTLLIATHDAEFTRSCAQRVLVLENGRLARDGSPPDVLADRSPYM